MFYLMMHSTHFIYDYMVLDHSDSMGHSFRLAARFFYMHHPTDRITHTTAVVK